MGWQRYSGRVVGVYAGVLVDFACQATVEREDCSLYWGSAIKPVTQEGHVELPTVLVHLMYTVLVLYRV